MFPFLIYILTPYVSPLCMSLSIYISTSYVFPLYISPIFPFCMFLLLIYVFFIFVLTLYISLFYVSFISFFYIYLHSVYILSFLYVSILRISFFYIFSFSICVPTGGELTAAGNPTAAVHGTVISQPRLHNLQAATRHILLWFEHPLPPSPGNSNFLVTRPSHQFLAYEWQVGTINFFLVTGDQVESLAKKSTKNLAM